MFLAKTSDRQLVHDFSLLTITSMVYRKRASIRLRFLGPWSQRWMLEEMFGTSKGSSAEGAAWQAALRLEAAKCPGGGGGASALSTDIFKCFDQLPRQLIFELGIRGRPPYHACLVFLLPTHESIQ